MCILPNSEWCNVSLVFLYITDIRLMIKLFNNLHMLYSLTTPLDKDNHYLPIWHSWVDQKTRESLSSEIRLCA